MSRVGPQLYFAAIGIVFVALLVGIFFMVISGVKQDQDPPPSEVSNSYGGQTYRECEAGWGPKHCHAYIFDDGGDQVCVARIPNTRAANREIDLAAITCRED